MLNGWMQTLMPMLREYVEESINSSMHFDFMTLFRRIVTHPDLTDFTFMIVENDDVSETDSTNPAYIRQAQEKFMTVSVPKLISIFKELPTTVTVEDLKTSTYDLHPESNYSFMEYYWIYIAWWCFGVEDFVDMEALHKLLKRYRGVMADKKDKNESIVALSAVTSPLAEGKGPDLMTTLLHAMDRQLIAFRDALLNKHMGNQVYQLH